jgi:Transcription initiation factor IIE, alpha subunit
MIGGDEYLKVARSLLKSQDATDEEIASSTGLRINMVRKVLYDLFGKALISGIRVKDERKVGLSTVGVLEEMKLKILLRIRKKD